MTRRQIANPVVLGDTPGEPFRLTFWGAAMPVCNLTARMIENIQPTPGKRVEYADTKARGLVLRVTEHGMKTWALRYRHRGRSQRLTLAPADALPLADARERALDLLQAVSKGADPAAEKQDGRKAHTIGDLAELYITKWAKPKKRSWKMDDNLLRHKVLPRWQHRAIADITRQDVRMLVEDIAEGGAPIVANRVVALLSKMFAFALDRDLVTVSPAVRIARPGHERQRDRVVSEDELRTLWRSFEALDKPRAAFYKLRLLTAQRGGEVTSMRWQDLDLSNAWWTIPAGVSKNRLAHRVPLSPTVVTLIETLKTAAMDPVFVLGAASRTKGAGARGKRQQSEAAATFTVSDFRGHDLRRTAASMMASGGIPRLTISKILNHVERSITAVYDRHSYDAEKRAALDWWDRKLQAILNNKDSANVLSFAR
jgi:integrase